MTIIKIAEDGVVLIAFAYKWVIDIVLSHRSERARRDSSSHFMSFNHRQIRKNQTQWKGKIMYCRLSLPKGNFFFFLMMMMCSLNGTEPLNLRQTSFVRTAALRRFLLWLLLSRRNKEKSCRTVRFLAPPFYVSSDNDFNRFDKWRFLKRVYSS